MAWDASDLSGKPCGALAFGVTNDELTDVCSTRAAEVVGLAVEVLNEEFWKFNGDGPATFRSGPGGHGMRASGGILPVRFRNWIIQGKVPARAGGDGCITKEPPGSYRQSRRGCLSLKMNNLHFRNWNATI
jgi:hypothetical protein